MNKKGQGLSMNVIIIAAISLLVLVIISVLVLQAGGNVNQSTGCTGVGGECVNVGSYVNCNDYGNAMGGTYIKDPSHGCGSEDQFCCVPLTN